jgi:hypothetical protein
MVPTVAGVTGLRLEIHVRADLGLLAGEHDGAAFVKDPDVLHSRLGANGFDDLVQAVALIQEHAVVGATLYRGTELAGVQDHVLEGLLFLEENQVVREHENRRREDQRYRQAELYAQTASDGPDQSAAAPFW